MKKVLLFVCAALCSLLHGMDENGHFVFKEIIIPQYHLAQKRDGLQGCYNSEKDMLRTFAIVNKLFNKNIEDTYRPDKKRIQEYIKTNNIIIPQIFWNRDFTQGAWISTETQPIEKSCLLTQLSLIGVFGNDIVIRTKKLTNDIGGYNAFEDMRRPYFSKVGNAVYLYGYGITFNFDERSRFVDLFEYSLQLNDEFKRKYCFLSVNDKKYTLYLLFNFPVLLRACFKSIYASECTNNKGELEKNYLFYVVDIPDNYTLCEKSLLSVPCNYESYDELPRELREAIDSQYKAQQWVKKSMAQ